MDQQQQPLFKNRLTVLGLTLATSTWLACLLTVALYWNRLPPELPFLYSLPWGEAWLIKRETLVWVLGGFGGILILNLLLTRTVVRHERLLQNYLIWGAAAVEFILAVNLIKIISLVI
jgi:hypothetical protein